MNNEEFRKEMHQYLNAKYDAFEDLQQEVIKVFQAFHQVCKKNQIPYYMMYGSLIGLVRDGGCIPWDYDMDVALSVDYREQLKEALTRDLPEEYYVLSEDDEDFEYFQIRVCKKGVHHSKIHLDVFYMVGAPEGEALESYKAEVADLFNKRTLYMYYLGMKKRNDLLRIEKLTKFYYGLKVGSLNVAKLNKEFEKVAHKYSYGSSKNVIVVAEVKNSVERSLLDPPKYVQTSIGEVSYPHDEVGYLDATYKNYREYLPIQKRFGEFYTYVSEFDKLAQPDRDFYNTEYYTD